MPVYNGQDYIQETIQSVLGQPYDDFEYIIMDDGSTDRTKDIISSFTDPRIKLLELEHGGIVKALQAGLMAATGEYVIRIDADDVCEVNRFAKLITYMDQHLEVVLCGTGATIIDEQSRSVGTYTYPPEHDRDIRRYMVRHNPFIHPSIIMRRKVAMKVGGYRDFKHTEDYELWTRMLQVGKGHNIPEMLIRYRKHTAQITRKRNIRMRLVGIYVRLLAIKRLFL